MKTLKFASHPVVADRLQKMKQLSFMHRLAAYAGGLAFGIISYLGWRTIMATEFSATTDHYIVLAPSLDSVLQINSLSLVLWLTLCITVTTAILYLVVRVSRYSRMIHEVANTDFVTEAYAHKFLVETLRLEALRAKRYGRHLSLLVMSLDRLEGLSEDQSSAAHDPMLQWLARLSRSLFRNVDLTCRYGRDCIAVILPEAGAKGAVVAAERIRNAAGREAGAGNSRWASPISVGIAEIDDTVKTCEDLLVACDVALCQAKRRGGNQVCTYSTKFQSDYRIDSRRLESLVQDGGLQTAHVLAIVIDAIGGADEGHSAEVARYSLVVGRRLGMPKEQLNTLKTAALLHDIGKIAASKSAGKTDSCSAENHSIAGSRILAGVPDLSNLAQIVRAHHEHFDGSGIPDQLSGDDIPVFAKIIATAQEFVRIRRSLGLEGITSTADVLAEMMKDSGTKLDPVLLSEFAEAVSSSSHWDASEAAA